MPGHGNTSADHERIFDHAGNIRVGDWYELVSKCKERSQSQQLLTLEARRMV